MKGTFERTAAGLRRLQAAAARRHAPLRVSINTTVAQESLETLDQMVDVAGELGVDAIGLNHLMFATPAERDETLRLIGETDPNIVSTFITSDPGITPERVRTKVAALQQKCRERNILFDYRPKVHAPLIERYYTPGASLVGALPVSVPAGAGLVQRQGLLLPVHPGRGRRPLAPDARGGLELGAVRGHAPPPAREPLVPRVPPLLQGGADGRARGAGTRRRGSRGGRGGAARTGTDRPSALRAVPIQSPRMPGLRTLFVNPPPVNGIAFTRQGRCQEREEVLGTTKPPYSLLVCAALVRERQVPFRLIDQTAASLSTDQVVATLEGEGFRPELIVFPSTTPTLDADVAEMAKLKARFGAALVCFGPHASTVPQLSMARAAAVDAMVVGEPEDAIVALASADRGRSRTRSRRFQA